MYLKNFSFPICNSYCMVQVKGIYIEVTAKNVAKIEVTIENYERR